MPTDPDVLLMVRGAYLVAYLAIVVTDLRWRRIPNLITYPLLALALIARPDAIAVVPLANLVGGAVTAALFTLLATRGWMGMGDAKLAALIVLASGPVLGAIGLWLAFMVGGLVSLSLMLFRLVRRGDAIQFGPFLALGGCAVLLFPELLLQRSGLGVIFG